MTGKVKAYTGPHKALCDVGGKEVTVRIPVNVPKPEEGGKLEFKESWIVAAPKADKPAKAPKADKPVEVTEAGEVTAAAGEVPHVGAPRKEK